MEETMEELAIKAARGNNGGTWADHYTEEQKNFWRAFVQELVAAEREACAQIADDYAVEHAAYAALPLAGRAIAEAIRNRQLEAGL
jgi:hypothetical protein